MKDEDFGKPIIAIANSFTKFVPGHVHLRDLGRIVAAEIEQAGGVGREFNTIAVDDGIAMGHDGMLYSMPSRDLIADSVEYMVNGIKLAGIEIDRKVLADLALRRRPVRCPGEAGDRPSASPAASARPAPGPYAAAINSKHADGKIGFIPCLLEGGAALALETKRPKGVLQKARLLRGSAGGFGDLEGEAALGIISGHESPPERSMLQ
jgi:hypothetical protein